MKAVLVFGEFRWWGYELSDDELGRTISIMHPWESEEVSFERPHIASYKPPKRMQFEYRRQLDHDLYEYVFTKEIEGKV